MGLISKSGRYPLEEEMATHSSVLAWRWTEEPGGLWPIGSQTVGHSWAHTLYTRQTHMHVNIWAMTKRCYCTLGQEKALCIPTAVKLGDGERIELAKPQRMETVGWLKQMWKCRLNCHVESGGRTESFGFQANRELWSQLPAAPSLS